MLVGHQEQWEFLKKAAEKGKIPHAFLFCGQEQLGKRKVAVEFAKLLNCENSESFSEPCQTCRTCRDIEKNLYPDFILIEPLSSREIRVRQIRELLRKLSLRSYLSSFKIALIDKAHLMNREAQSCFLKTLEEPKGKSLLILATEYPEILFPTIISRTQKIKFFPVGKKEIAACLSKIISQSEAEYLSSLSLGRPGKALDFLLEERKLKEEKEFVSDLNKISDSNFAFRFKYAKKLSEEGVVLKALNIWLNYFRDLLLLTLKEKEVSKKYSLKKLKRIISLIQSADYLISGSNVNSKLALEILLMEL